MSESSTTPTRRRLQRAAWLGFALALVASSTPLLSSWLWPAELLCHFRLELGIALALLGGAGLIVQAFRPALLTLGLALYAAWPALLLYVPVDEPAPAGGTLRVASVNLLWGTDLEQPLLDWLDREQPDVVFFCELDQDRKALLGELARRGWSHQHLYPIEPWWDATTWGRAMVSKRPFVSLQVQEPGPLHDAVVEFEGRPLRVIGAHPMRPGYAEHNAQRNATLARLGELAAETPAVVVLGDLNVTQFSPRWGELLEAGQLADSRRGRGLMGSWLVQVPKLGWRPPLPRRPLDHVLFGADLVVVDRRLGPDLGSDHLPVVADVGWR
jgi:endonuclease/exonuclease/phosphatase family metal-dependent hydrolase